MMAACPWLGWGGGLRNKKGFFVVIGGFVVSAGVIWALGYRQPTALVGASAAVGIVLGAVMLGQSAMLGPRTSSACGSALPKPLYTRLW